MYKISFTRQAVKALQKMPRATAELVREKLNQLANDPFATHLNATKMQGRPGFRLRVGDWRVIYEVQKDELLILVLKIAPRSEVYR